MPDRTNRNLFFKHLLPAYRYEVIRKAYGDVYGFDCFVHDEVGQVRYGESQWPAESCLLAVQESLRWGETVILMCETSGQMYWSTPLMMNDELCGGLAVAGIIANVAYADRGAALDNIRDAAEGLTELVRQAGLLNSSAMREAQRSAEAERGKAEAIHLVKNHFFNSIQSILTHEEPSLLGAIRRGERANAIEVLNRILVAIYHHGAESQELRKSYLLELAAMMSRAAVEAGCKAEQTLGMQFGHLTQLADLEEERDVAQWLHKLLDQLFEAMSESREHPNTATFNKALAYMEQHLDQNLKREQVARHVHMSSSHFAHMLASHAGTSFREVLAALRVERAARMLSHDNRSLAEIAYACGFSDQSHFSRVFSKALGQSPGDYRKARQTR